jgi:hypothetical protein
MAVHSLERFRIANKGDAVRPIPHDGALTTRLALAFRYPADTSRQCTHHTSREA